MKRFFLCLFFPFAANAQFAPAAGQAGSTAIHKDSSLIINWANGCEVTRGYQNISNTSAGTSTVGTEANATGPADVVGVISLGDGGNAVITFQSPLRDLNGPDFCVFENSFDPGFLELAFVEVSSDGVNYTRFPATCNVQNTMQIGPFDTSSDASKINNLAGKYVGGYGVPFDLQELQGSPGLDVNNITHVKIIDVIGCIQPAYASLDKNNNIINDLWPTEFGSGGFDLDAVGVIHQQPVGIKEREKGNESDVIVYPSVTADVFRISTSEKEFQIEIKNAGGSMVKRFGPMKMEFDINELPAGIYFVVFKNKNCTTVRKIVKL